jgi:hypothetical protein
MSGIVPALCQNCQDDFSPSNMYYSVTQAKWTHNKKEYPFVAIPQAGILLERVWHCFSLVPESPVVAILLHICIFVPNDMVYIIQNVVVPSIVFKIYIAAKYMVSAICHMMHVNPNLVLIHLLNSVMEWMILSCNFNRSDQVKMNKTG